MLSVTITPEFLVTLAAGLLAVVFDWLPPAKNWYDQLKPGLKRQVMLLAVVAIVIILFTAQCANVILLPGYTCQQASFQQLAYMIFLAVGVNQGVHFLTKPAQVPEP